MRETLGMAVAVLLVTPSLAWAHGGGLDEYGCHRDKKANHYHCHVGEFAGNSFRSQREMLAARNQGQANAGRASSAGTKARPKKGAETAR